MNTKIRENANKGFSLVELIVVIAIMAVLTAVLAPALLGYVENSRKQKDDSAMGEVTNAVQLALADQDVYDEVLFYTAKQNVSCYIDADTEAAHVDNKVVTKEAVTGGTGINASTEEYNFSDEARKKDETYYYAAGHMRGVTITFEPALNTNASSYTLSDAIINKFIQPDGNKSTMISDTNITPTDRTGTVSYVSGTPAYATAGTFENMTAGAVNGATDPGNGNHYLFNKVRATIGDSIELTSQTYRNSEYTVFIKMGTTGGNDANAQDAMKVYGQWNGTNLSATERN